MNMVAELFGHSAKKSEDWKKLIKKQWCPFLNRKCYKVRKSDPKTAIGSCTVLYGPNHDPIVICPTRLTENLQIFTDCLHLFTAHEPGNALHIVSEVAIPGGSVDHFLVSAKRGKVRDFVGIEIQTLDTTGTVWPERQRLLAELGVLGKDSGENDARPFGMNWKMTAKTILVQVHHKVQTFEHINKKLVLVTQDRLLAYMSREFSFRHLASPPSIGDSVHFHPYRMIRADDGGFRVEMGVRQSTDSAGVAECLGLQAEARVELDAMIEALEARISPATRFVPV
jgi:hypothetical protein